MYPQLTVFVKPLNISLILTIQTKKFGPPLSSIMHALVRGKYEHNVIFTCNLSKMHIC